MSIYLRDEATSKAVRKLAKRDGITLTEAVRKAVMKELSSDVEAGEDVALRKLQAIFASHPLTGKKTDKKFYDSLYEE
jgi:antitoxin VapB